MHSVPRLPARERNGRLLRSAAAHACLPLTAILASCGLFTEPDANPPGVVSAVIDTTGGPIFRTLTLRLEAPAAVEVQYHTEDAPALRVRRDAITDRHVIAISRLYASRSYQYEVRILPADALEDTPFTGRFTTGPLPADLAAITFDATGTPEVPLVLLHLFTVEGFRGYAAIDAAGKVVWYYRTHDLPFGITRRAHGNFVAMDRGRGLVEFTPAGEVIHELPQDVTTRNLHHDVIATPDNTLLFIAQDARAYDDRTIVGEAIWEWNPETGETVKRWSAHDFLDPAVDWGSRSTDQDWLHSNSLDIGERGNILLSLRRLNQVLSIAPDWSRIEWRMGGVGATIPVAAGEQFGGQHTAAEVGPDRILLFDNRYERGGYSRAAEFEISNDSAHLAWEWRPERDNFAFAVSSARRLTNGNTLVAFGMSPGVTGSTGPIEAYEVTAAGDVIWHVVISGAFVMYRAEPLESIAGESVL